MSNQGGELPQDASASRPRKAGWLRRSAVALAVLALLILGAAAGQLFWPRQVVVQQFDASEKARSAVVMPNVVGLLDEEARAAIADAGHVQSIAITQRAAAGDPGTVLEQNPPAQADIGADTSVALVVSTPATMPDLVGSDQRDAQNEVEKLGGAAQFETVVDAGHSPGTILSTEPQANEPMPQIVRLSVASGGVARLLTDLSPLENSRCSRTTNVLVNGQTFASALTCTPRDNSPARATYALSRKAGYLRFTLGVPDRTADTAATAKVTVIVDGTVALSEQAKFGASTAHTVPLTDALRMEIVVDAVGSGTKPEVALGDIALMGLASDLDQLR